MTLALKPSLRRFLDLPFTIAFYAAWMLAVGLVLTLATNLYFKGAFWLFSIPGKYSIPSVGEAMVVFSLTGIGLGICMYFTKPSSRVLTGMDYIERDRVNDAEQSQDH